MMTSGKMVKVLFTAVVLAATCAVASAQEGPSAGKIEIGGFPGGGLWLTGGNTTDEVNFNNYDFGGGVSWYVNPKIAVEGESAFGLGITQNIDYQDTVYYRLAMPHTLGLTGNVLVFPGGTERHVAGYVAGGGGTLTLLKRTAPEKLLGVTGSETFTTMNVGGGIKIFRRGDARNWGFRIDYRLLRINSGSGGKVPFFAQTKGRTGHRFYIGMLYTLKR